jgi:hypothetical protein
MLTLTKREWIEKLTGIAKELGNKNPWALGCTAYDALREKMQGLQTMSGEEWYAKHKDDPQGWNDKLTAPQGCLKDFVQMVYGKIQGNGGATFHVIPSSGISDTLKYLMSHPKIRGNLLDMAGEDPWDLPRIDFENMIVEATNQFLSNKPINVVFRYTDEATGLVVHQITLGEYDFLYFVSDQQMKIADRRW